ncbi:MAG: hypothetical protein JRF15_16520 [Deltaproteobacteria bacterium]|jgi:hypothetical protein|nr:hypothetical protein [Deltaproteobacteria bacterium]
MVTPSLKQRSPAEWAGQRIAPIRHAWLALALIALACGEAATPEAPDGAAADPAEKAAASAQFPTPLLVGNHLRNPGFEAGNASWGEIEDSKQIDFEIVREPTHSGRAAARLVASWQPGDRERPVSIRSAIQEISPPIFPDRISGWYRVDRWEDTPDPGALQLEIIVGVIGDPRTLEIVESDDPNDPEVHPELDNFQLRYRLAGPTEEPEDGGNIRNRAIGKGPPELKSWVYFDLPVKSDFEQRWNHVPANFRRLRVLFAVRWDDKEEGAALHADVYYDDLFFGFDDL